MSQDRIFPNRPSDLRRAHECGSKAPLNTMVLCGLFATLTALGGCIPSEMVVDGIARPIKNLAFVGKPYEIRHNGAHPGYHGTAGGLSGRAC